MTSRSGLLDVASLADDILAKRVELFVSIIMGVGEIALHLVMVIVHYA